ncbi:TVP38/TMEM64 family protein [Polyangium sorediatum]|uniref:TVP38/TMEM64 family membrane protein n=1 Tax=Polyangium sorediatum TaxID=889274 RepID=A0ABT6NKL1_9BACT|nr:VTT domain-containing protein [Polyangium sorediatum]MDI1428845.1 VTT domain-containing protein [Polyangium sorediatum]
MRRRLERVLLLLGLLALPLVLLRLPAVRNALVSLVGYMREAGAAGALLFLGVEVLALAITTPLWVMSGLAGYAYGFSKGMMIAWPGVTLGVCLCFLFGRASIGKLLSMRAGEAHFWRAVERAVRADGFKITFLLRVTFAFPQNIGTYMLSATPLSLRAFAAGSFLGLLPATLFHVYVGASVESAAALLSGEAKAPGSLGWITLVLGFVVTLGALVVTSRIARRSLDKALAAPSQAAEP